MEKNPQQLLEELIHRELAKLPEQQAPETLLPRVLNQIRVREQKRWWQRPWTQWPLAIQLASVPMLVAGVAAAVFGASWVSDFVLSNVSWDDVSERLASLSSAWDVVTVLANAMLMIGRGIGQQWLLLALLVPVSMYLACIGLGTLCYRTAFDRR